MIRSLAKSLAIFFLLANVSESIFCSASSNSAIFMKGLIKSLRILPRFLEAPGSILPKVSNKSMARAVSFSQSWIVEDWSEDWTTNSLKRMNLIWKIRYFYNSICIYTLWCKSVCNPNVVKSLLYRGVNAFIYQTWVSKYLARYINANTYIPCFINNSLLHTTLDKGHGRLRNLMSM